MKEPHRPDVAEAVTYRRRLADLSSADPGILLGGKAMRELNDVEVDQVCGGLRAIGVGLLTNLIYDGLRSAGGAIADHYDNATVAFRDDPSGRGRALL